MLRRLLFCVTLCICSGLVFHAHLSRQPRQALGKERAVPAEEENRRLADGASHKHTGIGKEQTRYLPEAQDNTVEAQAHYDRGEAYFKEYKYDDAVKEYREAIRVNPRFFLAHYWLAENYYRLNRYEEAIAAYKEVIRIRPPLSDFGDWSISLVDVYDALGASSDRLDRYDDAIAYFQQAMSLDPGLRVAETAYINISAMCKRAGRDEAAIIAYQRLLDITLRMRKAGYVTVMRPDVWGKEIAGLYEKLGKTEQAISARKRVVSLALNDIQAGWAWSELSVLYQTLGRNREAIESYQKVITLQPTWTKQRLSLGRLYLKAGDKKAAVREYEALKTLDPAIAQELQIEIEK